MTQSQITFKSWAMIATLGLTWGGTFLVIEVALAGITPFWLAATRIVFAALVSVPIWWAYGRRLFEAPPSNRDKGIVLVAGTLSTAVPFALLAWGQQYVTAGFAGVSMASVGLIVLPLAHVLIPGERMTTRRAVGFLVGFVGVCVLIGSQAFDTTGSSLEWPGRIACVLAAGCYGVSSVMMRRLPSIDPFGLSTLMLLIGAILILPFALVFEDLPAMPDKNTWIAIAFLGLVPTAAANLLRVMVIRSAGPVFLSLVNYQVPLWSVFLGAWLLGEPLPPSLLYALALILVGVGLSQYGALRRLFQRRA